MNENIFMPGQRIVILQGIEKDAGRTLSNEMIQRLLKSYGYNLSLGEVNRQVEWLERRGYAQTERLSDKALILVRITRAGVDIALGNARADGIDPPMED